MSNGKIILGALAGLAVGSIIGILFAPEKGSRTRRKIMDKGEDYVDNLKGKVEDYMGALKDKYVDIKDSTAQLVSKATLSQEEIDKVTS